MYDEALLNVAFNFNLRRYTTAESLGIVSESVSIKEVNFEVQSSFTVAGMTLADWSGNVKASDAFADAMTAELGRA